MPGPKDQKKKSPASTLGGAAQRKQLLKELGENEIGKGIEGYEAYVAKMTALDKLMEEFSAVNSFGATLALDGKGKEALLKAIKETAEAGEKYLQNAMEAKHVGDVQDLRTGVPGVVNRLQGMLARDEEALNQYDPSLPLSLPQVLETGRSEVVFLDDKNMDAMKGAQNARIPITFRGRDGKEYRGVFTKATKAETLDEYVNGLLETASEKCGKPAAKAAVRNLIETYRGKHMERLENASDSQVFNELYEKYTDTEERAGYRRTRIKRKELGDDLGLGQSQLGISGSDALEKAFNDYDVLINKQENLGKFFNSSRLGMEDGARIDSRNTAMSSVAKLLGKPELIANSVNMKFMDKKGQVMEGSFMDYADGIDLAGGGKAMRMVNEKPFEGPGSYKAIRQMADLQVLDYLCGNIDRHQGNLMYKTDANGDIVGVQGIDNDSSFGRFANKEERVHALAAVDDMGVISASMSKKVMGLTPAMLKYALRGHDLSEEELDFAAKRLTTLQTAIKEGETYYMNNPSKLLAKGHLRTVADGDFQKLKIKNLCQGKQVNLFLLVYGNIQRDVTEYKYSPKYAFDPQAKAEAAVLRKVGAAGRGFTGGNLRVAIAGAAKLAENKEEDFSIDGLTKGRFRSSPQFDAMAAAAKKMAQLEKDLLAAPVPPTAYNLRLKEIDAAMETLRTSNDAYLAKKMGERKAASLEELQGKNEYEAARIEHAKKIKAFVDAYEKPPALTGEDLAKMNEQDKAEFRVAADLSEMHDLQEAYRLLAEIHKANAHKLGSADPEAARQQNLDKAAKGKGEEKKEEDPDMILQ